MRAACSSCCQSCFPEHAVCVGKGNDREGGICIQSRMENALIYIGGYDLKGDQMRVPEAAKLLFAYPR